MVEYLFPLLRFHSRWNEIGTEDFKYLFSRDRVSHNGYMMQTAVVPGKSEQEGAALFDYTLPTGSMQYLDKMRALCAEKGIELILIKAPTNYFRYHWYDEWDAQIVDYAAEKGLTYYNFMHCKQEIGLDMSVDTYDAGIHLNVYGAEKLTRYFGAILRDRHALPDRRDEAQTASVWRERVKLYFDRKADMESLNLNSERNLSS